MQTMEYAQGAVRIPVYALDCLVIGSGCAGYNAADWLYDLGRRDIAVLTEGKNRGTSRNTGSDKQTYYKLSLSGADADSVQAMADDLFAGGGMHGDSALAQAAGCVPCFMKLCQLGVPFPTNRYGEYVGYKTDHDPRQRATSAGPLTSQEMTQRLEAAVESKGIPIFDGMQAVRLLVEENRICGVLCVDLARQEKDCGFTVFCANHVILATGGPAGVYKTVVYPQSQVGGTGMALQAGAGACNLDQWQYGLASLQFRWNVSGTYQQVLPRYITQAPNGAQTEWLPQALPSPQKAMNLTFLKGYQWPFDAAKIEGSSFLDLLVYQETCRKGNRVFLDYQKDPVGFSPDFAGLGEEAASYLRNSGADMPLPINRLEHMNPAAVELYRCHQIDLHSEMLEIGVCAQHHNGGIAVDADWQSSIRGLYVAGEAAGTFGARRPGGSALNACQVGAMRAAQHIAYHSAEAPPKSWNRVQELIQAEVLPLFYQVRQRMDGGALDVQAACASFRERMSECAALVRIPEEIARLQSDIQQTLSDFYQPGAQSTGAPAQLLRAWDIMITQLAVLDAMQAAAPYGSRGSALVANAKGRQILPGLAYLPALREEWLDGQVLSTQLKKPGGLDGGPIRFCSAYEPVRPMPQPDRWFESVWGEYRARTQR